MIVIANVSGFDLPIEEIKGYISDLMVQIGEDVTIDGIPSKAMLADVERIYSNLEQNMKQIVLLYETEVERGSIIIFDEGKVAIVYTVPNDDIVSLSAKIVVCNSKPTVWRYEETFDEDPSSTKFGDIKTKGLVIKGSHDGFIERLTAREKQMDVGLLHDAILRFITVTSADIVLGDTVKYKNKQYKVIDADDITDGILVIQLANVRI